MPIRSGAMHRPRGCRCGNTLRQRYDDVGLSCRSTMGSPSPASTYAISLPRTRRRCFRARQDERVALLLFDWRFPTEEVADHRGDLLRMGLEREVSGVEEMDLRIGNVALERLGTAR